jgi:DNA-binding NtrC family response regulator
VRQRTFVFPSLKGHGIVSAVTEPQRTVACVLVIAADPNIESLIGQLVAFAGHRPAYDPTSGAGGESLRRTRPDVVLLDNSLPHTVLAACLQAADEIGANAVLTSSTDSESELATEAHARRCLYFALPGLGSSRRR